VERIQGSGAAVAEKKGRRWDDRESCVHINAYGNVDASKDANRLGNNEEAVILWCGPFLHEMAVVVKIGAESPREEPT
jgi:hypothetical protein